MQILVPLYFETKKFILIFAKSATLCATKGRETGWKVKTNNNFK